MKAITPVIALVMLLLITVGIVGMSYAWLGGIFSGSINKAILIPPGGAYCDNGDINVYVLNDGDAEITTDDIIVAEVDGVSVTGTPFFGDMSSGLVGYWKFDDGSGYIAKDSSGNGNDGDLINSPEWVVGRSRNALKFDGTPKAVNVGVDLGAINTFSASAWIKTVSVGTVFGSDGSVGTGFNAYVIQVMGGAARINLENAGVLIDSTETVNDGYWHHVTVVKRGGSSMLQ